MRNSAARSVIPASTSQQCFAGRRWLSNRPIRVDELAVLPRQRREAARSFCLDIARISGTALACRTTDSVFVQVQLFVPGVRELVLLGVHEVPNSVQGPLWQSEVARYRYPSLTDLYRKEKCHGQFIQHHQHHGELLWQLPHDRLRHVRPGAKLEGPRCLLAHLGRAALAFSAGAILAGCSSQNSQPAEKTASAPAARHPLQTCQLTSMSSRRRRARS